MSLRCRRYVFWSSVRPSVHTVCPSVLPILVMVISQECLREFIHVWLTRQLVQKYECARSSKPKRTGAELYVRKAWKKTRCRAPLFTVFNAPKSWSLQNSHMSSLHQTNIHSDSRMNLLVFGFQRSEVTVTSHNMLNSTTSEFVC